MSRITSFFKELWAEIIKAIFPPVQKPMTAKEILLWLRGKNKNELMRILIRLSTDYERTLPEKYGKFKKQIKSLHSKNEIIDGIMKLLAATYPGEETNVHS